jgi:hypothetical protein
VPEGLVPEGFVPEGFVPEGFDFARVELAEFLGIPIHFIMNRTERPNTQPRS